MTTQQYFDSVVEGRALDMQAVRNLVQSVFPEADETMAYKLPTYVINNEALV